MDKLTEVQIAKINGINTDTKKMGLGNIIQDLIIENESLKTTLKSTKTVINNLMVNKVTDKQATAADSKV